MTSPFLCIQFKDLINFAWAAYIAGEIVKCIAILAAIPSALSNYLLVTSTANSLAGWNKPFRFFYGGYTFQVYSCKRIWLRAFDISHTYVGGRALCGI